MPLCRDALVLTCLLLFAAGVFLTGVNWGLPSHRVNPFLFGSHPVWSGQEIDRLAPPEDPSVGADVDANPIIDRDVPILLNDSDAKRAEIIRRYRLFSYQPDEMITFKSLARIRQFNGDPRLYQYGGLWIYPVGVMLKAASIVGLVDLRADPVYYLDHPEAFGRFYIVARVYVVFWGLVGVWCVFWIARRLSGDTLIASAAAGCYTLLPVVVNMAHEAKPHLPGAVLSLLAIIAAAKFVDSARPRWALIAGALCGAAFGMVLSSLLAFVILPVMILLIEVKWAKRFGLLIASTAVGFAVYAITNPFVVKHLLTDPQMLRSNLANSSAMYQAPFSARGLLNAAILLGDGATPLLAALGGVSLIVLVRRYSSVAWLLASATLLILVQFILLATNKPGEYARFALLPDIVLALSAVVVVGTKIHRLPMKVAALGALVLVTGFWGAGYVWHFGRDSIDRTTRIIAAERLEDLKTAGARSIALDAEPAPYSLPPVDLFQWKLVLVRRDADAHPPEDVYLRTTDRIPAAAAAHDDDMAVLRDQYWIRPRLFDTPIAWAAKPYRVSVNRSALDRSRLPATLPATTE